MCSPPQVVAESVGDVKSHTLHTSRRVIMWSWGCDHVELGVWSCGVGGVIMWSWGCGHVELGV